MALCIMFQKVFNKSLYSWDWTDGSVVIGALAALPEDPSLIPCQEAHNFL